MAGAGIPCITNCRQRESEPEANRIALGCQNDAELLLESSGYTIIDRFGDAEFAPPFSGWLEPRPGWHMALIEARRVAAASGACALIILYADSIGSGDPFLPDIQPDQLGAAQILVCNFGLCTDHSPVLLADAQAEFEAHAADLKKVWTGSQCRLRRGEAHSMITFEHDTLGRFARVHICNPAATPLRLQWQCRERMLLNRDAWPSDAEWRRITVDPMGQLCLRAFVQGEMPTVHWLRFKRGAGRETEVGNVLFTSTDLSRISIPVSWYAYEPTC